jgi:hemerythrin-like domain-containing protein
MAQIHNVMVRGLNSMLIQAPFISTPTDTRDFIDYALSFCVLIHEHHNTEEVLLFPLIEDCTGVPGIMDKNVVQHEAFVPKLHDFKNYLTQIKLSVRKYDPKKFVALLNSFAGLMAEHLMDEVKILEEMEKYAIDWKMINERTTKHAVETANKVRTCFCIFPGCVADVGLHTVSGDTLRFV